MSIPKHVFFRWGVGIFACFSIVVLTFLAVQYGLQSIEVPPETKISPTRTPKKNNQANSEKKDIKPSLSKKQSNGAENTEKAAIKDIKKATKVDKNHTVHDITPSFDVVRVTPNGETVIAGRAAPHQSIHILNNGKKVSSGTTDDSGHFVITLAPPLSHGSSDLSIQAISKDGTTLNTSKQHIIVSIPEVSGDFFVGLLEPGKPLAILEQQTIEKTNFKQKIVETSSTDNSSKQKASDNNVMVQNKMQATILPPLTIDAAEIEDGRIFIAGSAKKGADIRLYVDDVFVGQSRVEVGERFLLEATGDLVAGAHRIRADHVDGTNGKVIARVEVPFNRASDDAIILTKGMAQKNEQNAKPPEAGMQHAVKADGRVVTANKDINTEPMDNTNRALSPTVIIRRGDNLWRISRRYYGRGIRYSIIYDANRNQIRNPHWIFPGQVFDLPSVDLPSVGVDDNTPSPSQETKSPNHSQP